MLEQIDTSTAGEADVERLRADFRHLRFLICLTSQAGAPSACACYPNPSSKAKILGALLAVGESRAIFHPASQESLFRRKLCQAFCNISYSQACPLAFLTKEHFVQRQLMTHLHLPIKMILGYFSPPLPPVGCLWFAELVRANYIGFFIEGVFPLCMCFLF